MKSGIAWMDYIFHIPTVTPKELKVKITPDFDYLSKLVDPTTGNVINDPVLTVEGKEIYLYERTV